MASKIFISYRRDDSAANALGIGHYLAQEFGRRNVFIDVDIGAGAKFPVVLERRLAECKVPLVVIGLSWLDACDDVGKRRLDDPEDWVRLEIGRALRRKINVIPVRVNGAELPKKVELPEDIRGLLDHQAVVVTTAGFRNEMAGLARDIKAIPDPWSRIRKVASVALPVFSLSVVGIGLNQMGGWIRPPWRPDAVQIDAATAGASSRLEIVSGEVSDGLLGEQRESAKATIAEIEGKNGRRAEG